jgi:hypothetical protein
MIDAAFVTDMFEECAAGCANLMNGTETDPYMMEHAHGCHRGCERDMCHGSCSMMYDQCAGIED